MSDTPTAPASDCKPTNRPSDAPISDADQRVCTALHACIDAVAADRPLDTLNGMCVHNAVDLYCILRDAGYPATVIRGGVPPTRDTTPPASLDDAIAAGSVHWWVDVVIDGQQWTVDVASPATAPTAGAHDPPTRVVQPGRPPAYHAYIQNPEFMLEFATAHSEPDPHPLADHPVRQS